MHSAYKTYSITELLDLLSKSDDAAFTEIYNRFWEKLLFVAGIKCRDLGIAEEIVQEIFLDIWKRRTELHIEGNFEHYLAVCVKYKVINAQAKLKKFKDFQHSSSHPLSIVDNSTEQWLDFEDLKDRLSELVDSLPDKCRITYQLSKEAGLSHREVAMHMNISEKGVEANLARAMKLLRINLKHFYSVFLLLF